MLNNFKKKLQFIFKKIGYSLFFLLYGKVADVIKASNNKDTKVDKIFISPDMSYRIFKMSNSRIYTDTVNDTAFIIDKKIIEGPSFQNRDLYSKTGDILFASKNVECKKNIVFEKGTPKFKKKIKGSVFSLLTGGAGNSNYWHWLFDVIPRFAIVEKKISLDEIDFFLLPSTAKKFQQDILNLLDIPKNKRLSSFKFRHVHAETIIAVDHPWVIKNDASKEIQNIPIWIIDWLKSKFIKKFENNNSLPKKIYINRKDAPLKHRNHRSIKNEKEVEEFLKKQGYVSLALSEFNFIHQVNLFNNADSIVGLHGAGFANVIFCSPKTNILELKSSNAGDMYKNLSLKNNLIYSDISIETNERSYQQGHIEIPLSSLKEKINQ